MAAVFDECAVVMPVGPEARHSQWLDEALQSVATQQVLPSKVVVVRDGGLPLPLWRLAAAAAPLAVSVVDLPWTLGVAAAFNVGIASAGRRLVIMLCADDRLLPNCVRCCRDAWERYQEPLGYYYFGVQYSTGGSQNTPCGAAMVTQDLWRYTGGFFPQCAVGAADHIFLHALLAASRRGVCRAKTLKVADEPVYWYRSESNLETASNNWPAIEAVKEYYSSWTPPGERTS